MSKDPVKKEEHPWLGEAWQEQFAEKTAAHVDRQILLESLPTPERWWQCRVVGHPTQYELEVAEYQSAQESLRPGYRQDSSGAWVNPRSLEKLEFTNEFLAEPVPPLDIKVSTIPMRPVSHPPPPRGTIEFLPTKVILGGLEQDPEDPKEALMCSLCNHRYREHTGEREPHNTKCTVGNFICGRFFLDNN